MIDFEFKEQYTMQDLIHIMQCLRAPGGCPWDREQTHQSIKNDFLEEVYEVADAIQTDDSAALCEELGDVLLQVVFHTQIATENGTFEFDQVTDGICKKLILRHPHVFGDTVAETSDVVLNNWDKIKRQEKHQSTFTDTLQSVPKAFPALMRAQKVQKRAAKAGMDWPNTNDCADKLSEEVEEFKSACQSGDKEQVFEELGDLLFSVVNLSRFLKINAEEALAAATDKFIRRFEKVEALASAEGHSMDTLSADALDDLWQKAKQA